MTMKIEMKSTNLKEHAKEIKQISLNNPGKIVTAYARFGHSTAYVHDKQPRTDSPDTIQTYEEDGGFWKNGKIVSPTKAWFKRYNFIPCGDR